MVAVLVAGPAWVVSAASATSRGDVIGSPTTIEALTGSWDLTAPYYVTVAAGGSPDRAHRTVGRSFTGDLTRSGSAGAGGTAVACSGKVAGPLVNGRLSSALLCDLWQSPYRIRIDAVASAYKLNDAFVARFGRPLCVTSGYRTYAEQARLRALQPGTAAPAGTSDHGLGVAIDFCPNTYTGEAGAWLRENGPSYGWENPAWAQAGGSGPYEPWQWNYAAGTDKG